MLTTRGAEPRRPRARAFYVSAAVALLVLLSTAAVVLVSQRKFALHIASPSAVAARSSSRQNAPLQMCAAGRDPRAAAADKESGAEEDWVHRSGVMLPLGHRVGLTEELVCVTHRAYLEFTFANNSALGSVELALFGTLVPKSVQNFVQLCTCELAALHPATHGHLCYHDDSIHRVVRDFVIQGGSHATGRSVFGATFREQESDAKHSVLSHASTGVVSWAEYPIGSQFFIVTAPYGPKYLDNNHVLFAVVIRGMDVVRRVEALPLDGDKPIEPVRIRTCGLLSVEGSRVEALTT